MKAKPLATAAENPVAAAIRRAIGASETEPVAFTHRPISRLPGWPKPTAAPAGFAEFSRLFDMTGEELKALGCGCWDGGLYLFPGEWYDYIPARFPVESTNGTVKKFEHGKTPRDLGFGMLAFGVRIGPGEDDES